MRNFFTKRKIIIIIVGAIVAVMLGLLVGNNIANTIKARERTAEKAKIEKTVADRKKIVEDIEKAKSNEVPEENNYSEDYKEYLELSDEEKAKQEVIPRKENVEFSELEKIKEKQKENLGKEYVLEEDKDENNKDEEVLPKYFNLKDKINLRVESQGSFRSLLGFCFVKIY